MPEITVTTNDLLEKQDISKLLRSYVVPAMINMVVMALYNIVDRIFIGQGAGAIAICGLALTLPCVSLITTVGTLTGVGAPHGYPPHSLSVIYLWPVKPWGTPCSST